MHYPLVHFDVPHVDGAGWRLGIDGLVEYEMSLSSTICGTARR
jgi:DMSO/TMAO reductase YedYZ molybdopterin-dependent catalytic subunit